MPYTRKVPATPPARDTAATPQSSQLDLLVENHRAFLRFLERRVGSREAAEDILQDAFGRAVQRVNALREDESAIAWFYRVLRNAVIDYYRRRDVAKRRLEGLARELERPVPQTELHEAVCACVGRLATGLKPEYARALQRIEIDGLPVKEFAAQEGISANNAGVRISRARAALKKQVVASCGTCADHGCFDCRCGDPGRG